MMEKPGKRVVIVSARLLVAQGLKSLLSSRQEISHVHVACNLYEAQLYAQKDTPDIILIDLPIGARLFVDRPLMVNGREIKTIVVLEGDKGSQALLYIYNPSHAANLPNLMWAILHDCDRDSRAEPAVDGDDSEYIGGPRATAFAQLNNLIKARASDPSSSPMSSSSDEL
jgi:DNA-binding NarL/FixJ family response regulator